MKLNTKLLTISALFIAALMLLSPISQINTSGGGGTDNYDLDFLNSLDINNNNFVLSADSLSNSVDINNVEVDDKSGTKELQCNGEEVDSTTTFISISDVEGLKKLSTLVNDDSKPFDFLGYTIVLTADLDFTGESNFTPIGKDIGNTSSENNYPYQFKGTFDGQGHTISNLKIDRSGNGDKYAGLFGYLGSGAIVKNLGIINSSISTTSTSDDFALSGGIAGYNQGKIENCYNTGDVTGSHSGGIAGRTKGGTITNCYNTGDVTGYNFSGGIVGWNSGGKITNCYNSGAVTASSNSGGIAGSNGETDTDRGKITNCYNAGNVTGNIGSGGITANNNGTITNCYNSGDVIATPTNYEAYSGGIAGKNEGTIENCYNTGDMTADSTNGDAYSGGVAGHNEGGTITNCHNTGDMTADSTNGDAYSGGVAGYNTGTIENCYNSGVVTATSNANESVAGGIVGKNENSTVQYCYSKQNGDQELIGDDTGAEGCKFFGEDGNLSDESGSLLDALNEWVTDNEQNPDKYRYWMDPFIQDEEYPVFTDWYGEAKRLNKSLEKNSNGVYVIENEHQLALIADDLNGSYVLSKDINLSGYEWRPIGNKTKQFSGTFDGQGNTISNLSVKITSDSVKVYSGLFGYLDSGATVKNLGITNSVIFTNTTYIDEDRAFSGGIAGYNTGTVMNCYYTGTVIGTGAVTFGGIVGENKNGTVTNCYNTGTVIADTTYGTADLGGIAGHNDGTIQNCYNTGIVIADTTNGTVDSGGIVGYNDKWRDNIGKVINCYNTGDVTATATEGQAFSGGIAGFNIGTITNCYNTGDVTATATKDQAYSGGVAGFNSGEYDNSGKIENCYNTGDVTATANKLASSGGIAGYNAEGAITNCYNTGVVTGSTYSGGIAGYNWNGTITNCYNTGVVTGSGTSGGIAGKNDGAIKNCYYLKDCVSNDKDEGNELDQDAMTGSNLLSGDNNLNKDKDGKEITDPKLKPWSPDIFGVNNGYPILADVPTQIDPNSTNAPPQSAVYVTLDTEKDQAENYLKPFMLTGGKTVNAVVNCLNDQTENIPYQWYEMKNDGTLEEVKLNGGSSEFDLVHGTYYVKITINGYSYTSLTRTASNIVTVSFDSNGGSAVAEIEIDYGTTIARPEDPTRTGYTFEGWYSDETLNTPYNFKNAVSEDTTLYAKWKLIEYSVEYNGNNNTSGTVPIDTNKEYTIGNTINIELNDGNLAKSGHIFRGWNYTPNASSALSSPIILDEHVIENYINTVPNNTILNLYAVWTPIPEPIYTLCLNSNDSTLQTKRYSGTYGTEVTLKSASDFGWNNECTFIEWNSKSDGSGISYKEGDKFSLGSDVWNLYAIWSDSSYHTVSFDSNGGNNVPSQSVQDGYRASEPTDPVKQGHSFKHWSLNGTKYDFNQSVKEDITLKAEYEVISYKVTFYYNGDVYYSTVADYNTSLGDRMPSLPSDKDKWNTSENGKGSNFTSDSLITNDTSVYAVSENSITSILIIGGSAAAILAAIAAWLFMRSRYN